MLKWAKGSKNGGGGNASGRVSLADLRRASAKLLRRKDSTSKAKNVLPLAEANVIIDDHDRSSPPPLVPPRGSSAMSSLHASTTTLTTLSSGAPGQQGVIRQATVRRMPTLRQSRSTTPPGDVTKRPGSSSSNSSSCSSHLIHLHRNEPDNSSSLYMQLDKIPVAVQCSSKRKALEDISNQAYRQIIRSMQDELALMSDAEEPDNQPDDTKTLAEAVLLPINVPSNPGKESEITRVSHARQESVIDPEGVPSGVVEEDACQMQAVDDALPPMNACPPPFNCASSPLTKTCHTSTGQHVHHSGPVRSLASGLPVKSACSQAGKKSRVVKQVTFDTEARLIGDSVKLPVVFESDHEDSTSLQKLPLDGDDEIPGFVNVPCNRRGFCLEALISGLPEAVGSSEPEDEVDNAGRTSPDGYDWQPSYVNLEDTEIAPVLLASSRPADDSSDFWRPRTVGDKKVNSENAEQPVYDAPANHGTSATKTEENIMMSEFASFRYALPDRRSISNGSSGSDTQDSGVAEMAQVLSLSRAASASPQLAVGSRQSISEEVIVPTHHIYNTLPRADGKKSQFFNDYWTQREPIQNTNNIYSATTDPHILSNLTTPSTRQNEEAASSPSSSVLMAGIDTNDASWSSDHLYCNMAPVDPMPTLSPRASRRCHSLLALDHQTDADYENVQPQACYTTPARVANRLNISHARSRSLRHSGDFSSPFAWMISSLNEQVKSELAKKSPDEKKSLNKSLSARRQQLIYERAHRLELMLNDAANDYSDLYEHSDWSMEAMLSDTVRDMDGLDSSPCSNCKHCCCTTIRVPPPPPQCRCQFVFISNRSPAGCKCQPVAIKEAKKRSPVSMKLAAKLRESVATQTETSPLSKTSAAENPLYMAYNDLTKIDEYERSVNNKSNKAAGSSQMAEDYASDGCETWNSHRALYARLKAAQDAPRHASPAKRGANRKHKSLLAPSSSRIWRHEGNNVSTPQKNSLKRRVRDVKALRSANVTADSSKLDRSTRSTKSTKSFSAIKRRKSKPRASDVLHGKGQLQLSIYLNSGLLTIHVQSARYLRSRTGELCNTYVKISLIPDGTDETSCRTTLVKRDNDPWYDQKFSFEFLSADLYKRLFISVWHRDSNKNRSEFLGCMSFSVSHVIRKDASGWYRLLNSHVGRQRHFAVKKHIDLNNSTIVPTDQEMEEDLVVVDDSDLEGRIQQEEPVKRRYSHPPNNLVLLEKPPGDVKGKTPYTITMRLKRGPKGFGFSVTWTHPPRIERVEPGMAADEAGMKVGDYVVFVGNHNVVKMDEEDVLKHIQSSGDDLTLEVYRKSGKSAGLTAHDQSTMAELQKPPTTPQDGRLSKDTDESKAVALHRAKHGLINAETGLCLAAHATVNLIESRAGSALPDKGRMAFYLRKLEKMGEEHVDYMVTASQLGPFNIHATPLMMASELHKLKKLLDRVCEHLPFVTAGSPKFSSDNELLANQFRAVLRHLDGVHDFLRTLNELLPKNEDRIDYFLDAFQVSVDKLRGNVHERLAGPPEQRETADSDDGAVTVKSADAAPDSLSPRPASGTIQQNIVYAASIRQAKLHSNVSEPSLIYQGFLWKREGPTETRYWALLFDDSLLLTHVNNGVHFVDEEPVALHGAVRIMDGENRLDPAFRLMYRPDKGRGRTGRIGIPWGSCSVLTLRAKDWDEKMTWVDLIQSQIDKLQNRDPGLKESEEGKRRKESGTMDMLRRAYRCISSGAIPSQQSTSGPTTDPAPSSGVAADEADDSSYYHSYSCDDLYLSADGPRGADAGQLHQPDEPEVFSPGPEETLEPRTEGVELDQEPSGWGSGQSRAQLASRAVSTGASLGVVAAAGVEPGAGPSGASVTGAPPRRTADRIQRWAARLCTRCWQSTAKRSEHPTVTIRIEDADAAAPSETWPHHVKINTFSAVLDPISEDENSSDSYKMRQFQSSVVTNADERHVLHSTGDSTETSPSWASASSSAMETPNDVDQPLAFDFSRKCDLNPDGRQQLVLPKNRVSYSMPTTPEMSEASPSPRQVTSGFFRFPFVGNASPRRVRARAMSAEGGADEMAPSVNDSSSAAPAVSPQHQTHANQQTTDGKKLRFSRFLRRTHSASAAPEAPPYALFLRNKRMVSKTRSADLAVSASSHGPNDVFSSSVDESSASAAACRKTRLSEMRLRLGFLRRRSTESSLSARPPPEEAQKWTESFMSLMASKYGAALYRAFLLREFSNENLEFWLACEEYKNAKPQKLAAKAQKIYNDFVAVQAPKEVNLDAETRLITLTNVQSNNPDPHAFDRAQRRIQHMMERDSYLRFLQSELFLELVHPERYSTPNATSTTTSNSSD